MLVASLAFAASCLLFGSANGLGCIVPQLCQGQTKNMIANAQCDDNNKGCKCDENAKHCGIYGAIRYGNSLMKGVDIRCDVGAVVTAPFDGTVSFYRPLGGQNTSRCLDEGLQITGSGQWAGYVARISYIKPIRYGGEVKRNQKLGFNADYACTGNAPAFTEPHILFQLSKGGRPIDPTHHLTQCMCTGRICESNPTNELYGHPFKYKETYGKGYEIKCPNIEENGVARAPMIFNPIGASALGRFRPFNNTRSDSFACENDGVFLEGAKDTEWQDFFVHIYNVHFDVEPKPGPIEQGKRVASRLDCPDLQLNTIFVEFRYRGRLVNVSNILSGENCSLPTLPD